MRVSSTPTARGTRVERGGAPSPSAARRAIPEPSEPSSLAASSADRRSGVAIAEAGNWWSLPEPERRLIAHLVLAVGVIVFITVVVPFLITLVRNF